MANKYSLSTWLDTLNYTFNNTEGSFDELRSELQNDFESALDTFSKRIKQDLNAYASDFGFREIDVRIIWYYSGPEIVVSLSKNPSSVWDYDVRFQFNEVKLDDRPSDYSFRNLAYTLVSTMDVTDVTYKLHYMMFTGVMAKLVATDSEAFNRMTSSLRTLSLVHKHRIQLFTEIRRSQREAQHDAVTEYRRKLIAQYGSATNFNNSNKLAELRRIAESMQVTWTNRVQFCKWVFELA